MWYTQASVLPRELIATRGCFLSIIFVSPYLCLVLSFINFSYFAMLCYLLFSIYFIDFLIHFPFIFTYIIILSYYPIICSPRPGILFPCEDGTLFADPKHGLYIIKENVLSLWDKCLIIKFIYIYPCGSCFKGFITINTTV